MTIPALDQPGTQPEEMEDSSRTASGSAGIFIRLRAAIVNGDYSFNERLPSERALAAQFEVSRPTIREAMIALEIAGRVEVRSGSGVYVLDQSSGAAPLPEGQDPGPFLETPPSGPGDGGLWSVSLPRNLPLALPAGRGCLIAEGAVELAQVAWQ